MKKTHSIVIFILMILGGTGYGQDLLVVKDSLKGFQVGVPDGWMHSLSDAKLALVAMRLSKNSSDVPREVFNINILYRKESDLNISYGQFLVSIGKTEGLKILEEGEKVINGRKYKYLIETHKNAISKEDMSDYVVFTNDNGKIVILTLVTTSSRFNDYKSLFERIAMSLTLHDTWRPR